MAKILFPSSTAPGKDAIEGGGRLVNAYAETLPEGAPAPYVIRRPPGLSIFGTTAQTGFRSIWYDGQSYVYAAVGTKLFYFGADGTATEIAALTASSLTFLTSSVSTSDLTTYTYSAVAIGTAHFNRHIVVGILFDATDDYPPASVTIGGVSATLVKGQSSLAALYIAKVPTGTTADIVVTYATAAVRSAIGVWRLDGLASATPHATGGASSSAGGPLGVSIAMPAQGVALAIAVASTNTAVFGWLSATQDFSTAVEAARISSGASATGGVSASVQQMGVSVGAAGPTVTVAAASWAPAAADSEGVITFAKNNKTPTADQVLVTPSLGAFTFTTSALSVLDVNSEVPNSVCFGEGYFFFTTPAGLCYASGLNATTVSSLDVIRTEAKAEALVRGIFFNGELYLFGLTHTEVWGSGGNPNDTGFPLNRVTVMWRGLVAPLAVCGFEDGFHPVLVWVADDYSVRMADGYSPVSISPPDLDRAIEACSTKSAIRCAVYHIDGHACIAIDLAGEATWVYDLDEQLWHERRSHDHDHWRFTGNTVRAFGKWIGGDHHSGNLLYIDDTTYEEDGDPIEFMVESISMESFPTRLQIPRADFNFVSGVGDPTTPDPEVKIQWSDDGGHRWSDPVTRKLGEAGRYLTQVRVNRCGLTGVKGRRWRLTVSDPVYVGLLGGDMTVQPRT